MIVRFFVFLMIFLIPFALLGATKDGPMTFKLTSPAFTQNSEIPSQYTCDGSNMSIPLRWQGAPEECRSFVLIVDDPDAPAGTWDHWLLFNIPNTVNQLNENTTSFSDGTLFGKNSWGRINYGGPCPPDKRHRYFFKLYAIDQILDLKEGASKSEIMSAIHGHVLAETALMGTYDRRR